MLQQQPMVVGGPSSCRRRWPGSLWALSHQRQAGCGSRPAILWAAPAGKCATSSRKSARPFPAGTPGSEPVGVGQRWSLGPGSRAVLAQGLAPTHGVATHMGSSLLSPSEPQWNSRERGFPWAVGRQSPAQGTETQVPGPWRASRGHLGHPTGGTRHVNEGEVTWRPSPTSGARCPPGKGSGGRGPALSSDAIKPEFLMGKVTLWLHKRWGVGVQGGLVVPGAPGRGPFEGHRYLHRGYLASVGHKQGD